MTPDELNALTDEALFQRIDAIVESRSSVDYVPCRWSPPCRRLWAVLEQQGAD